MTTNFSIDISICMYYILDHYYYNQKREKYHILRQGIDLMSNVFLSNRKILRIISIIPRIFKLIMIVSNNGKYKSSEILQIMKLRRYVENFF